MSGIHLLFNDNLYDQLHEVYQIRPMSLQLSMGHHKKHWLEEFHKIDVLSYTKSVDDLFQFKNDKDNKYLL